MNISSRDAEMYRFDARKRIYKAGLAEGTEVGLMLALQARSATLLGLS